jgi:RNA polymerase sigma-70 factor (ECF subfamily)
MLHATQIDASPIEARQWTAKNTLGRLIIGDFESTTQRTTSKPAAKVDADLALVKRFQEGDLKTFDILVIKYQRQISRVISMHISDQDAVKDVTQEAFIRAYKGLNNFRLDSQFYTWLYRIAVNSAYSFLKSNKKFQHHLDVDDQKNSAEVAELTLTEGPEKTIQNEDLRTLINRAVSNLPIALRTALLLREQEGLSYEQIANIVDCQEGTVKSRISRARDQIMQATKYVYRQ